MSNTLNGTQMTAIARRGLKTFADRLTNIKLFTTDFSSEVASDGAAVTTRIIPAGGTAQTFATYGSNRENAASNITTTAVTVTLDTHPISCFAFTDEEFSAISSGVMSDMTMKLVDNYASKLADYVLDDLYSNITNGNYGAAVFTGAASTFEFDDVVDIEYAVKASGTDWHGEKANMCLTGSYVGALKKDVALADKSASGKDIVAGGPIGRVGWFDVWEALSLGTQSENLIGFVSTVEGDGLAVAFRAPSSQAADQLIFLENFAEEDTNAPMQMRSWYDPATGRQFFSFEALYGDAVGNSAAIKRLVSS